MTLLAWGAIALVFAAMALVLAEGAEVLSVAADAPGAPVAAVAPPRPLRNEVDVLPRYNGPTLPHGFALTAFDQWMAQQPIEPGEDALSIWSRALYWQRIRDFRDAEAERWKGLV